jgi:DNA-binding transcriptional LysR family regulator
VEFRHLSYAVAVARAGSFSRAASELRIAQPSLSTAIAQLETELQTVLFERSTRGVTLTPAGAYLVRQAQRILRDIDEMRGTLRSMAAGTAGSITLGLAPVLAWQLGQRIMRAFTASHPDVELAVRERNAGEIIELLLEGAIDVGLVATASSSHLRDFHRGLLTVERLGSVELVAALPQRYADSPDPLPLSQIADEEVAIPPVSIRTFGLRAGLLKAFDQAGLPAPRMRDVPSLFEAIPLAMAGMAVGIVPDGMRGAISSPDLVLRRLIDGPAPLDVSLLYRSSLPASVTTRMFARVARQIARETGVSATE